MTIPFNMIKEDLRTVKTKKIINIAVYELLEHNNFKKITVKDICEKALISRATFYAHFIDKYDLLKCCLADLTKSGFDGRESYENLEKTVNQLISENKSIIKNIIEDANDETRDIVFNFILSFFELAADENSDKKSDPQYIVLSNIFAGGMISYLLWSIKNKFPFAVMNVHLRDVIEEFREWELK